MSEISIIFDDGNPGCVSRHFRPLIADTNRFLVLMGGRDSGKSWFASQKLILRAFRDRSARIAIVRKVARSLRQSVFKRVQDQLAMWGMLEFVKINLSDMTIRFPTGSEFIFWGLDDPAKKKSMEGITSAWMEEATEFSERDFAEVDIIVRGQQATPTDPSASPTYHQVILSLNPISAMHWIKKRFFDKPDARTTTDKSTYRDNDFCPEHVEVQMNDLRERNPSLARVWADAEWGILEGLIYRPPIILERWPDHFEDQIYGLDFGFNNPTALVDIGTRDFNRKTRKGDVYLREVIYESDLTTPRLAERMRSLSVDPKRKMYCDSSEPDRIEELRKHGFNAVPASKGPGSVKAGIDYCQSLTLYSEASDVNLNGEFQTYSWEVDKDGTKTDTPVKFSDHLMDAFRMGVFSHFKIPEMKFIERSQIGM